MEINTNNRYKTINVEDEDSSPNPNNDKPMLIKKQS